MKDMLSINEFAKLSGIEATTLRYWDEIGLFTPAMRDPRNNYRRYSAQQVITANFITVMSSLDIPLKAIAQADDNRDPESIVAMIEQQEKVLDKEMIRLQESYSIIHTRRELINYARKVDESQIGVISVDAREIILGPPSNFKAGNSFYEPFVQFYQQAKSLRINPKLPIGGYHENMDSFLRAPGQPYCFFSLDPTGNSRWEAGEYLTGFVRGYYGEFSDLPDRMAAYAEAHALVCTGPVYSMYLLDEICYKDPDQYLAQVAVAVTKPKE